MRRRPGIDGSRSLGPATAEQLFGVEERLITRTSRDTPKSFNSLQSLLAQWIWGDLGPAQSFKSLTIFAPRQPGTTPMKDSKDRQRKHTREIAENDCGAVDGKESKDSSPCTTSVHASGVALLMPCCGSKDSKVGQRKHSHKIAENAYGAVDGKENKDFSPPTGRTHAPATPRRRH